MADKQNYPFCRLQLLVETFGHSTLNKLIKIQQESPKLSSQQIRKRYYNTLGTSLINSPMLPPSMTGCCVIYTGQKSKFTLH